MLTNPSNFTLSDRLSHLRTRSTDLSKSGKRNLFVDNPEFLVYHWSGLSAGFSPATGEMALADDQRINIGDHNCRVDVGTAFPSVHEMPSKVGPYELSVANWARDYEFFLDHSPAEVYPDERIVGEFHWQLDEARKFAYPDEVTQMGFELRQLGAGGTSLAHTCPDLGIGLGLGWDGLLHKVQTSKEKWTKLLNNERVAYLQSQELVVGAIQRYISRHAERAATLAESEPDALQRERYLRIAENCQEIAGAAPKNFEQAIQWIQFYQVVERINGHGNGYGRLDQLLVNFYERDLASGEITHELARELMAELYLKYGGNYFSFGGRDRDGNDATNAVSWIGLEAYDLIGGYNHLGVMWHKDMDPSFYHYACDVLTRHGCGVPTLVSYDVMRDSELYSGYRDEDAWNVSYSGCQWYCAVGSEYSDHDLNSLVLTAPLQRAMQEAERQGTTDFESFWSIYDREVRRTAEALVRFKNKVYQWQSRVWPEMVTSLCMHGPIEKGLDVTAPGSVNNAYTSVNILAVPNVVDSLYAIQKVVFEEKRFSIGQLNQAIASNWEGHEPMRQLLLTQDKFGNDLDAVDAIYIRVAEHIRDVLESQRNIKGFNFRPSLFQFMGHTYAGPMIGATPDGRLASDPIAHGCNPMHGRNTHGITATANSLLKIPFEKYQGGSLQIELQPKFFDGKEDKCSYIEKFSRLYMDQGGVQINMNVVDLHQLQRAYEDPKNPDYADIVVKVTGYSAHFVVMDPEFQREFIARVNYEAV
jgi:formate C-acetyltransferase